MADKKRSFAPGDFAPSDKSAALAEANQTGFYTVRPGDTLSDLANIFGVSVDEFVERNQIRNKDRIFPGQRFGVPGFEPPPPPPPPIERDPWNPANIPDFQPHDIEIMAEEGGEAAPDPNVSPVELTFMTEEEFESFAPTLDEGTSTRTPTERVVDHFMKIVDEFKTSKEIDGQKALFALELLGTIMGAGSMSKLSKAFSKTAPKAGEKATPRASMTEQQAVQAESKVAEAIKLTDVPQPTEAMQRRLQSALRARRTPSTQESFIEGLEWNDVRNFIVKNERDIERQFRDIDQLRIPYGKREPGMETSSLPALGILAAVGLEAVKEGYTPVKPFPPLEPRAGIMGDIETRPEDERDRMLLREDVNKLPKGDPKRYDPSYRISPEGPDRVR